MSSPPSSRNHTNSTFFQGSLTSQSSFHFPLRIVAAASARKALRGLWLVLFLILCASGSAHAQTCSAMSLGNGASLNGFVPFPATNAWNTNVASLTPDPNSAAIVAAAGFTGLSTHVNFGSSVVDGGIPYVIVDSTQTPAVSINVIDYANQSDVVLAPFPANAPMEGDLPDCSGWPDTYNGDAHVLVLDRAKCVLYETWNTNRCNGQYNSSSETTWDMKNYESRPWGWTSADAAGLPVFPGLVRYDEVASGVINHAIRFTLQHTKNDGNGGYFVEPASHAAGTDWGVSNIIGMKIRLKASFNISGYSAANQVILKAMQQYGMILADNGGDFFIQGATDPRWDDADLANLAGIPSSEFDVMPMTPEFPGWDSETAPTGSLPVINSFTATATSVSSGSPLTFDYNLSGDSYDFIDMIGPITAGTGSVTINPTATQTYTLYSTNAYGQTVSTPILVSVPGSVVAAPILTPPGGAYAAAQTVTMSTSTYPYAAIYYTTDGSTPTYPITGTTKAYPVTPTPQNSQGTVNSITVASSQTVKAIAVAPGYSSPSSVGAATYTIGVTSAAVPTFSPDGGTFTSTQQVTISTATTTGSPAIYYTTDGTTPTYPITGTTQHYTGAITVSAAETLNAITVATGFSNSGEGSAYFSFIPLAAATPSFNPAAGTYPTTQSVAITTATTTGSPAIYYTTDGSTPSYPIAGTTKLYSSAISVSSDETLKAITIASGLAESPVGSAAYLVGVQPVAVIPNATIYPFQVLPGATRQINVNITGGALNTINWSVLSTTGGASATFTTPAASNTSTVTAGLPTVQVNFGSTAGNCSINGTMGSYSVTSTASVIIQAQSVDDPTKTGIFNFNLCAKTTTVLVAPAYQQAFKGQHRMLQSWVSGDTDETGTWSITSQPSGGNGTLADTTNRDVDFVATVTGRYTLTYTSHSNPAKSGMAIVYVSPNAMPAYVSTPNKTEPRECYVDPSLTGGDYEVGAGKAYPTLQSTPAANTLTPGSIIRVWNTDTTGSNPSTFYEDYQVAASGTPTQPVILCGVPDSHGNLPVVDGSNATTQSGASSGEAGLGIITLWAGGYGNSTPYGYYQAGSSGPSYVTVTGLHVAHATPDYNYTPPGGGAATAYNAFASCLNIRSGAYVDLGGNDLDTCGLGLYTAENSANAWASITQLVTATGNHIHNSGITGSATEHQVYFESWYGLLQGNLIDQYNPLASGSSVKWRGVEGIFRYNNIASGAARLFDLVDAEDAIPYITFEGYLGAAGDTNCDDSGWCLGDTLGANGLAAFQESWQKDFIYGNELFGTSALQQIHYLADGGSGMQDKNGTLYFYSNTLDNAQIVFDTGSNGDGINGFFPQRVDARNNILWPRTQSYASNVQMAFGTVSTVIMNSTTNLMLAGTFTIQPPIAGAPWGDATNEGWSSQCDGTCLWPLSTPLDPHLYGLSSANYLTTTTQPYNATTMIPPAGSAAIEAGTALSGTLATMPVRWQYSIATNSLTPRLDPMTIGAVDYQAVAATPTFSPAAGNYSSAQTVSISTTTTNGSPAIYYTTDGSTPTSPITGTTKLYTGSITVSSTETVKAIATATGYVNSAVGSAAYGIGPLAATPTFNPPGATYSAVQSVTISTTTTTGSPVIYYTTDGTNPATSATALKYTGPVTVAASETLNAVAEATGFSDSAEGSAAYTINLPLAATPTFNPPANTYTAIQTVTISTATTAGNPVIFYTTDGSNPATSSTAVRYTTPVTVAETETLNAVAEATGYETSAEGTAAYTINLPFAGPQYVQACNQTGSYTTSVTCTLNGVGAGHTLVIAVVGGGIVQSATVTSSSGTPRLAVQDGATLSAYILSNTSAGTINITAAVSANQTYWLSVYEYANTAVSPLDGTGFTVATNWTTPSISSPNLTTTDSSDTLWSYCIAPGGYVFTPGSAPIPWSVLPAPAGGYETFAEDGPTTAAGTYYGQCDTGSGIAIPEIITLALKPPPPILTPTITAVSPIVSEQTQTITITGSGFGSQSAYTGNSNYISLGDTSGTPWYAGKTGDGVTLAISSWTDSQIVLAGLSGNYGTTHCIRPGDQLTVSVWNAQSGNGPSVYPVVASGGTDSCPTEITSVSPIVSQQTQTITITGEGFGSQAAYTGNSNYIQLEDASGSPWYAGKTGDGITLAISSWTDTQIVLAGLSGNYGTTHCIRPGDHLTVSVWNAQTGTGTSSYSLVASGGTDNCPTEIASVSPIVSEQTQTITITGEGFGTQAAYSGNSNFIEVEDTTGTPWYAGKTGNGITLGVSSWTDSQIVLTGFSGNYGTTHCIRPGDHLTVSVWNAQTGTGTASIAVVASGGTDNCPTEITSVSPIVSKQTQTITITGEGFGTQAAYSGNSNFIEVEDTTGTPWYAGKTGNGITLGVSSWTDSQIVLTGFAGNYGTTHCIRPGDHLTVTVWNAQTGTGTASYAVVAGGGTDNCPTEITSVSAILPQQTQTITIMGEGFGTQAAYTGDSSYIELSDTTRSWNAGHTGNGITLGVSSWTDSQIVLSGFSGSFGPNHCIQPGDHLSVSVWNVQTGGGPAVYPIVASSGTNTCP